jgi:TatD DNase family protein
VNSTGIVDSHCHLADYDDPIGVVRDADQAGIQIVAVTGHPDEYRRLRARLGPRSTVRVALGLHPLRAASFRQIDLARFFRFVPDASWIGEVGLDFSPQGVATRRQQVKIFETVLNEAQPGMHPLSVHSRGAEREVIDMLRQTGARAVLHWYSGPLNLVDVALDTGAYFSVNPAMLRSPRFPKLLAAVPRDRVLLETDGPYARVGRREARPTDLVQLADRLANVWGVAPTELRTLLSANYSAVVSAPA